MAELIGFGASTVRGAGDSQGGFLKRLEAKLAQAGHPYTCLNFGIGGNSTRDMLGRLDAIKVHLPCRAIVLLGCNDLPRERDAWAQNRVSLEEYEQNLSTILGFFAGPQTLFVSSFSVCQQRTGIDPKIFADYMSVALKQAAALKLKTWDLYAESLQFGDKYLAEDGLHFNDAGHELIAERLATMIVE